MKTLVTAGLLALLPAIASAHEAGGAHMHPHADPLVLGLAAAFAGAVAFLAARRDDES